VANDILMARNTMDAEELNSVRQVSQLRFASDIAPDAFAGYIGTNRKGHQVVERLPAQDDPMLERVLLIRERDYMFIDTLNEHYATFYSEMEEPYDDWRGFSYEEQKALRQMRKERNWSYVAGAIMASGRQRDLHQARDRYPEGVQDPRRSAQGAGRLSRCRGRPDAGRCRGTDPAVERIGRGPVRRVAHPAATDLRE
jgi:hypothetical protein